MMDPMPKPGHKVIGPLVPEKSFEGVTQLSRNTLYLLSPRLCFFIVLKRDLFVFRDDSLTS